MRLVLTAAAAALLAFPLASAFAQSQPSEAAAPPAGTPVAPGTPSTPGAVSRAFSGKPSAHMKHQTLQERFDAANTSHDGHLTAEQASAAKWGYVEKNFSKIDRDHRGYVTVDDIHTHARTGRAGRHADGRTHPAMGSDMPPKLPGSRPVAPPTATPATVPPAQ